MIDLILLIKWSQKWVICTKKEIPKRGDCEKKLKNYNGNEIARISTKFQFCYSPYVLDCPQVLI